MKQFNDKTFNQIGKPITESPHYMNTLHISFPYEYAANAANLNWSDIFFAITYEYMDYRSAIEHARVQLENDNYPQAVLDLACISSDEATFPHVIHPYIDELVDITGENMHNAKDKIMYILLKWVYEQGAGIDNIYFNDILDVAESIYHDFNFPESIASFASWRILPSSMVEPDLGSVEKNKARLLDHWKQFLDEQERRWRSSL